MAETIELGIVGISNKGDYDAQTNYEKLNVVTYEGSSYCAKQNCKGILPTNSDYWQLYAEKGEKGETGETGPRGVQGEQGVPGRPGGNPLVANSVSGMTDTDTVYVNTTDGNWYYYNGTTWVIGGVYQATEIAENDILLKQLNQSTKDYINIAADNIKNIGEIKSYSDFNFYQGAFNNADGYYNKDPYDPNRVVLLAEYPILIPLNKHYKLKVLNDYKMSIYTYTYDDNGYKNEQNITGLTSSSDTYYLSGSDNIYVQIRFFRSDTNDVLVENIQDIVSITEVSNINENNKILFGVPGNTEVSNRHLVESSDFEICNNVNILYSKDTQVIKPYWGIVASNDNKMIIEKYFNTNTVIIFKEDQLNYYGINCFANKGALYTLQKNQLSGLTLPSQADYFTVSETWNNLRSNTSLKIEKNGSNLTVSVQDEVGYTEFFSVNDSNIIGILTSSTAGYHQNLNNAYITTYSNLNFDGLLNRVRTLEETIKNGGGSSDTKISRFEDYNILCIGDSITEKNGRAETNWVDYMNSWLKPNIITNRGHSGTGIVRSWNAYANWYNDLDNITDNFDLILIMGNMNDYSGLNFNENTLGQFGDNTLSTQYGALKLYIEKLINKYPNAKIGWITSTPRQYQSGATVSEPGYLWGKNSVFENANTAIKVMCANYSIPVLDLFHESSLMPWNATNRAEYFSTQSAPNGDGVHPNEKGQRVLAYKIYDFIVKNF